MNKELFLKMSSWFQLLFLFIFSFCGVIVVALCFHFFPALVNDTSLLRYSLAFQTVCIFLIPACFCAYVFHERIVTFLKIEKKLDLKFALLAVLLIFTIQPLVNVINHYNQELTLPASMASIEQWMRESENAADILLSKLFLDNSFKIYFINLIVIALLAGVAEEFFFRGVIQQLFNKITRNHHFAIWVTAIIFSTIHFQFYGFFARMLLGAMLGYIFVWSGNLWISVLVHTLNNAIGVTLSHISSGDTKAYDNFGLGHTFWLTIVGTFLSTIIIYFFVRYYQQQKILDY